MTSAIGIAFGTSNSCVAVFQFDKVECIANDQGNRTTPSYVAFTESEILTGEAAKNKIVVNPENTIFDSTRFIGRKFGDEFLQEAIKRVAFKVSEVDDGEPGIQVTYLEEPKVFSPEQVCGLVLGKMKESADAYVGKDVKQAVVAVPAYFDDQQRQAMRRAGSLAGLEVLGVINEPTAAAIAYGLDKQNERNAVVFDLGGGTCDVSVLSIEEGIFEVKSTAGDTRLGGEDFDSRMVAFFMQDFFRKHKKDISNSARALRRLRTACELAKRTLSTCSQASVEIDSLFEGIDYYSNISRARFEELCGDLFRTAIDAVEKALKDANFTKEDIHDVILVGGSSRIPRLQKLLQDYFDGKELLKSINVDEVVAYGCAVHAAVLTGELQGGGSNDSRFLALTIGIGSPDGIMVPLISRNTSVPAKVSEILTTFQNNQTEVSVQVFEGERAMTQDNVLLGTIELKEISAVLRGISQIEVTFHVVSAGQLTVTLIEKNTGKSQEAHFALHKSLAGEEDKEVTKKVLDAEKHRAIDEAQVEEASTRTFLKSICYNTLAFLGDPVLQGKTEQNLATVSDKCTEVLEWLSKNSEIEKDDLDEKQRELEGSIRLLVGNIAEGNQEALCAAAAAFGGPKKGKITA